MPVPNVPYSTCKIVLNINSFLARRIVSSRSLSFTFLFLPLVTRSLSLASIDLLLLQKLRIPGFFTCIEVIALEITSTHVFSKHFHESSFLLFLLFPLLHRCKRSASRLFFPAGVFSAACK